MNRIAILIFNKAQPPNENKMSDGGRERALLELGV
jgi:hypothetical protein